MEIPKGLKIGAHVYDVAYPYVFKEVSGHYGQCDHGPKEIRISKVDGSGQTRPDSAILVTLIHEVLHAADRACGQDVFVDNEKAICGLAEVLAGVLIDNGYVKV